MYNRTYRQLRRRQRVADLRDKASHFLQEHEGLVNKVKLGACVTAYLGLTVIIPAAYGQHVRNTSFPDLNTGIVWRSKRALNTNERLELERLVWSQNMGVGEVLSQMGLLKG